MSKAPVQPSMEFASKRVLAYVRQCHDRIWKVLDIIDPENKPHTGDCLVVADKWIVENKPNE